MNYPKSPRLTTAIEGLGRWCFTISSLLTVLGLIGSPLKRPTIAASVFVLGVGALILLSRRGSSTPSLIKTAAVSAVSGAAAGIALYLVNMALVARSWGMVALILAASIVSGGVTMWFVARRQRTKVGG